MSSVRKILQIILIASVCSSATCALGEPLGSSVELGGDSFGIHLSDHASPQLIQSTLPAVRAAATLQSDTGLDLKQTLVYGSGKSIQGNAWYADTRIGYVDKISNSLGLEPVVRLGAISVTPNYGFPNQSNVKTQYALAGARIQYLTELFDVSADAQIGRNINPHISNVECTPGLMHAFGVEASAKYFGGRLAIGAEINKIPMGSGYTFEASHIYADYRYLF